MDSNELVAKYSALKVKKETLDHDVTVKEAEYNTLKTQYQDKLKAACVKYGVKTLDELKAKATKEETELSALLDKAEAVIGTLNGDVDVNL